MVEWLLRLVGYSQQQQLQMIGGVAAQIPAPYQEKHPEIDWRQLSGLRQFIERQYGDKVTKRLWLAGTEGVLEILGHLEKLLAE